MVQKVARQRKRHIRLNQHKNQQSKGFYTINSDISTVFGSHFRVVNHMDIVEEIKSWHKQGLGNKSSDRRNIEHYSYCELTQFRV